MKKIFIFLYLFVTFNLMSQSIEQDLLDKAKQLKIKNNNELRNINELKDQSIDLSFEKELEQRDAKNFLQAEEIKDYSLKIFGHDYISRIPTSISSTSDLPVPNDYIVSLNDKVQIILSGNKQEVFDLTVNLDGSILFPEIGKVQVAGELFSAVKNKINSLVDNYYVGVNSSISITELSAKKISIVGAISNPGTYLVNPFTTISNALAYAGGLEEFSSLRNIVLIRGSQRFYFDLYDLLIFGDRTNDINIEQGDTILIQGTTSHVEIKGEINRSMTYEYLADDTYSDLITFSVGFKKQANTDEITITKLDKGILKNSKVILSDQISSTDLREVYVGRLSQSRNLGISVIGNAVEETFFYAEKNSHLKDVIKKLKFSDNIYPFFARVTQSSIDGLEQNISFFSLTDPETIREINLMPNVEIRFFSREEVDENQDYLKTKLGLSSKQNFMNPDDENQENSLEEFNDLGDINKSFLKILNFGTQVTIAPSIGEVMPKDFFNYFGPGYILERKKVSINTVSGLNIDVYDEKYLSSEFLQINFPTSESLTFFVEISGQVKSPGIYSINSFTTLNDLYLIAGGFTEKADQNAVVLLRESIRDKEINSMNKAKENLLDVIIAQIGNPTQNSNFSADNLMPFIESAQEINVLGRLTGDLTLGSENAQSIILEMGDSVHVPSISKSVSISGEVLQPVTSLYKKNLTVNEYIEMAGGFTRYSDKKGIYIIKANGTSVPLESMNQKVDPGDSIVIPRNLEKLNTLPLITTSVRIISDIAFAAASLNILRN